MARARDAAHAHTHHTATIACSVNGASQHITGPPFRRLIDVLREDLGLTGTKEGCGEGECGACTVLIEGEAVNSCLIPICQVDGRSIRTVESLGSPAALNPLQQAFLQSGGAQCGICTPGMLMTATAWIEQGGSDNPDAIRRVLAGNLCRCTGYQHIVDAVIIAVRDSKRKRANASKRKRPARTSKSVNESKRKASGMRTSASKRAGASNRKSGPERAPSRMSKRKTGARR